jgi:hypothetical protein
MRERKQEALQRASSYLEVTRACFREAEVTRARRTAHVFRKLGQQYLEKAKRLNPSILATPRHKLRRRGG